MNHRVSCILCALLLSLTAAARAAQFKLPNHNFTLPDGFEIEIAAGTDLVPRPVSASFDEQGRLYVTDSSGSNAKPADQLANPDHRILRLEDTDGDGKFDKSVVFADKVMFPEGCLWYDGSVYVAAPPHIWKLTDTNNDGVADQREIWHDGKTLTGCANDLHGPFLGPDGWIYWTKGAFAEQTYSVNGKPFTSRAAHIFRARPDGSRLEPVITGGMDNPVGLAWTPEGELILCGTFFAPHEPGHRDGLIHAIYGGVYGKPNDVLDGHKRTGDLMPVMTHMGAAAPAAVIRYQSAIFGADYRDNLFCAQFNLRKISRHVLVPDGATFKTTDSDFLVSDNPDFHPTDVIEDADGSLLVLDTGAWYKLCCPTSQLAKPDVLGAIYRIRRKGAPKVEDPRGLKLAWGKMKPDELAELLADERPAVVERTIRQLAKRGNESIPGLLEILRTSKDNRARRNAVWTLTRIDAPAARSATYAAFPGGSGYVRPDEAVKIAVYSIGLWRDAKVMDMTTGDSLDARMGLLRAAHSWSGFMRRAAVEALGRISVNQSMFPHPVGSLLAERPVDRVLEHSIIYALIELDAPDLTRGGLTRRHSQKIALMALDQMDSGNLKPEVVIPLLDRSDSELRKTAAWIVGRHPEWDGQLAEFFRERLSAGEFAGPNRAELEDQFAQFAGMEAIQQLIGEVASQTTTTPATRRLLLRLMGASGFSIAPKGWAVAVQSALRQKDESLVRPAIAAARALSQVKNNPANFAEPLLQLARDVQRPDDLRLEAMAALPKGLSAVEPDLMNFLLGNLDSAKSVAMRGAAAGTLARAKLSEAQSLQLADTLKGIGPMEVSRLLPAFGRQKSEAVGLRLMTALKESKGLSGVRPEALRGVATNYPPAVQQQADALLTFLNVDSAKQKAQLDELIGSLPKGDIRRGQLVFNDTKSACASCHRLGYLGGQLGPDLTNIGQVRTERDLLEAVLFPSASFVRSYEPVMVQTKDGEEHSGVLRRDAVEEIVLGTGPDTEVRIARSDIAEMRPGAVSVMPAGLDQQLTQQELADLIAFLKDTKWGVN